MSWRAGLATALAWLALPTAAHAYVIGGSAWPGHRITYFNSDKPMSHAVALAIRAWNTSGADIRFVPVRRARAEVIIRRIRLPRAGAAVVAGACEGYADVGHYRKQAHVDLGPDCGGGLEMPAAVVAHELGHILGLDHATRGCATMTAGVWEFCGQPSHGWQYRCRLLQPDDVRGAIALYGGRLRTKPAFCDAFDAPAAPTDLRISASGQTISWRNPALPRPTVAGIDRPAIQVFVGAAQDTCPKGPGGVELSAAPVDVIPNREQSAVIPLPPAASPGRWCVAVFVRDQYGRGSSATTTLTVPPSPINASFDAVPDGAGCVRFSDSSTDPVGHVLAWHWEFGDGSWAEGSPATSHCYALSGFYVVSLRVTDDSGHATTTTQQLTVTGRL